MAVGGSSAMSPHVTVAPVRIVHHAETLAFLSDCNFPAADLKIRNFLRSMDYGKKEIFVDCKRFPIAPIQQVNFEDYFVK